MYIHGLIDTGLLGHGLLGNGLVGPGLVSSSGEERPPCFDKLVQWLKAPAEDGVLIDKIGSSGSEVGRPEVGGWYWDGDGTRYVDLNQTINLGTEHTIEFEQTWSVGIIEILFGRFSGTTENIFHSSTGSLTYRTSDGSSVSQLMSIDGNRHIYKIVRAGQNVEFYEDGNKIGTTQVLATNVDYSIEHLFARNSSSSLAFQGNCSYIQLTDSTGEVTKFNFESGNQDTRVLSTNPDVYGTIQNATGADRVQTTAIESDMDTNGVVVSDGASYWYDAAKTQLVPSGKRSLVRNGKATSFYDASGELATASFVGELKANVRVVDGAVDLETEEIIDSSAISQVVNNSINVTSLSAIAFARSFFYVTSDNTVKTLVFKARKVSGTDNPQINIRDLADTTTIQSAISTVDETEIRKTFTPTDNGYIVQFFATRGTAEIAEKEYYDFVIYEGDYSTGDLPASAQPVSGNSLINVTTKKSVTDADKLTTVQMFNHDDEDNIYPLVVPVDDFLNQDNPRFTKTDSGEIVEQLLYEEELVDPCLSNVQDYLGF